MFFLRTTFALTTGDLDTLLSNVGTLGFLTIFSLVIGVLVTLFDAIDATLLRDLDIDACLGSSMSSSLRLR